MNKYAPFWNKQAEKYAASPVADQQAYEYKLAETQKLFTADSEVLEFACGTGTTAIHHAPHVKQIDAIDFSSQMIRIASDKAQQAGVSNVNFTVSSIEELNPADRQYDVVLGMSILHLVLDRQEVLSKVFELTRPGGHFVSSTVCIGEMNPLIRFVLPLATRLGLAPKVSSLTSGELVTDLNRHGFEIEQQWHQQNGRTIFLIARRPAI